MARLRLPNIAGGDSRYLAARERLITTVRVHPAVLIKPAFITLGVVIVGFLLLLVGGSNSGFSLFVWLVWLGALGYFGWEAYNWSVDRVMITDKRIIKTSGVIVRRVATMPLGKVTDLTYRRDPTGRLLGYGTFVVESAGQDQALHQIDYLPRPDRLYLTLCDMMFGGAPAPPAQTGQRDSDD